MSAVRSLRKITAVKPLALLATLALGGLPAAAEPMITGFTFTGASVPEGQGGPDTSWMVEAWPVVSVPKFGFR